MARISAGISWLLCASALVVSFGTASASQPGNHSASTAPQSDQDAGAPLVRVAGMFGESDDEKAARLQHENNQDANIANLTQQIGDLEESLRRLTGQVETLGHRIDEMNDRMTRMQKDFDYKLCSLAAQQLGAAQDQGDASALPCPGQQANAAPAPSEPPPATGVPAHLAPPPGVLGTLPRGAAVATPPADNLVASNDTRPQFEAAMSLLAKAQYDDARAAFQNFADTNPKDTLTPQAIYWVGDIAFVQKDYAGAAKAFAEEIKKFPTGARAPESMLKLGQSLMALNQKKEGCLALGAIASKYPDAAKAVEQATAARHAASCR